MQLIVYNHNCKEDNLQMNKANERKYRVMTKAQLTKVAKDFIKDRLGSGDRIVDVNVDDETLFSDKLVFVIVVTKFHTVLRYTLWVNTITGGVYDETADMEILHG